MHRPASAYGSVHRAKQMFEGLTQDDLSEALAEMTSCLGVKEDVQTNELLALFRKKNIERCLGAIAAQLGLPIRISLSYVPRGSKPGGADGFSYSALTKTDWTGHGIGAITAQVAIPEDLPLFGTAGLQNYPIRVRISEDCNVNPDTFVAVMAHELSHVLLASLRHPQMDSELHTDLAPIVLGFREVIRTGRKSIDRTTGGNEATGRATTYGYLTDSQFDYAWSYVTRLLADHQYRKRNLMGVVARVGGGLEKATRSLAAFCDYFKYLDRRRPGKMRKEDALRIVQLHAQDDSQGWERRITAVRSVKEEAESFVGALNHYNSSAVDNLQKHMRALDMASAELAQLAEAIGRDETMLRKYIGWTYRLGRNVRRHF
jgi:hypothetical protein